uniref:Uncharacterized protein n=1 Tax=Esox lucius TaxID=8010 RepID=A0AAY5K776_ESOLU
MSVQNTGEPVVSDFFCWSVLNIIFCFWPLGVGALLQSRKARKKLAEGDVQAAKSASGYALAMNVSAMILGVGCWVSSIILIIKNHISHI